MNTITSPSLGTILAPGQVWGKGRAQFGAPVCLPQSPHPKHQAELPASGAQLPAKQNLSRLCGASDGLLCHQEHLSDVPYFLRRSSLCFLSLGFSLCYWGKRRSTGHEETKKKKADDQRARMT